MKLWLLKSEPDKYSFDDMKLDATTYWDGVRNYQAQNNMKQMKVGDRAFFYHSNKGKEIVGIVEVVKEYYPDNTDSSKKFIMVDVAYRENLQRFVTLKEIKNHAPLENMALVKQSRLSVMPVTQYEWDTIMDMSNN